MKAHAARIIKPLEFLFYYKWLERYERLYSATYDVISGLSVDLYTRDHGFSPLFHFIKMAVSRKLKVVERCGSQF